MTSYFLVTAESVGVTALLAHGELRPNDGICGDAVIFADMPQPDRVQPARRLQSVQHSHVLDGYGKFWINSWGTGKA